MALISRGWLTGMIAGARLPRGKSRSHRVHGGQERRGRREGEIDRPRRAPGEARDHSRISRMGSGSERSIATTSVNVPCSALSMSPTRKSILRPGRSEGARSRAILTRLPATSTATTSAPRRAAATDRAPVPHPASSSAAPPCPAAAILSTAACGHGRRARSARIPLTFTSDVSGARPQGRASK